MTIDYQIMDNLSNGPTDRELRILERIMKKLEDYLVHDMRILIGFHALSFID
jgi:hypothetical protein